MFKVHLHYKGTKKVLLKQLCLALPKTIFTRYLLAEPFLFKYNAFTHPKHFGEKAFRASLGEKQISYIS